MRSYEYFEPIFNLEWAKPCEAPTFPKGKRPTAAQRKGIRFEKSVALELREYYEDMLHGQWIEFQDDGGIRVCQPDFIFPAQGIVIECKLTYRPNAMAKLSELYAPLVCQIWQREFKTLQICKNLGKYKGHTYFIDQIEEAPDGSVIHHPF